MENLKIYEILKYVNGALISGDPNIDISSISISSKDIAKNALFIPICGEKADGHDFISDALNNGAVCVLTQKPCDLAEGKAYIKVSDTKKALQDLAYHYRRRFNIPFIGVTGSVGKSSTKEMIAAALSINKCVLKTKGNQNSQIGLPLTMFRIENKHDIAVIEMGISEFSEMDRLSKIACVDRAVITNIGISHIENLKTKENIRNEKLKIILNNSKSSNKKLFLNGDDPLLSELKSNDKLLSNENIQIIYFGLGKNCDYKAENIKTANNKTIFTLVQKNLNVNIEIPAIGMHNVYNALSAIAVGMDLGIDINLIKEGLLTYKNLSMRQEIHNLKDITVIDDSYNASPDSIKSGINVLKQIVKNRSIVVLADMLELGKESKNAHYDLGKYCIENNIDVIITVGNEAKNIALGAHDMNKNTLIQSFDNNEDASKYLKSIIQKDDTILVKGSRSMHTDLIVKDLISSYN